MDRSCGLMWIDPVDRSCGSILRIDVDRSCGSIVWIDPVDQSGLIWEEDAEDVPQRLTDQSSKSSDFGKKTTQILMAIVQNRHVYLPWF